jgi:hypothetical protein
MRCHLNYVHELSITRYRLAGLSSLSF